MRFYMGLMIDEAFEIVDKSVAGIKFEDLYEKLKNQCYFNPEIDLVEPRLLFVELCGDKRFQRNGRKFYSHNEDLLRKYTITVDDKKVPIIDNINQYKTIYSESIKEEIANLYLSRKKYKLEDGVLVDTQYAFHSYAFKMEENLNFPISSCIIIYRDEKASLGTVILCDDATLIFETNENFGDKIKEIEVTMDSSLLLDELLKRIHETDYKDSKLGDLVLNGKHYISKGNILKNQENAVLHAKNEPLTFIWGPPGTGKTHTLAKIVVDYLSRKKRVLMVSQSNISVDGATNRVIGMSKNKFPLGTIIRYGFPKDESLRNSDDYNSYRFVLSANEELYTEFKELRKEMNNLKYNDPRLKEVAERLNQIQNRFKEEENVLVQNASFVATTITKATVSKAIYEQKFDLVLFDEASMAYVPQVIFAASLAKSNFVCLGDYQQLPAIAYIKGSALSYDIFRYVGIDQAVRKKMNHDWLCMLEVQRRMHPVIAEFLSKNMYFNQLISSKEMLDATSYLADLGPFKSSPFAFIDLSNSYSICTKTYDSSYVNVLSAFVSMSLAIRLRIYGVGIITPYNAQARLIRSMIRGLGLESKIECSTVHQFQGSEKSIIIFDAVDCYLRKFANDLLTSDRLINVAISRAKGKFIFVGNKDYLEEKIPTSKKVITNLFRFIDHEKLYVKGYEILNYIQNDKEIICKDQMYCLDEYVKDLQHALSEVCIDIYGGFKSIEQENEIGELLKNLYQRGVKISVRFNLGINIPTEFIPFSINDCHVLNTITFIDNDIIWVNMPENYGEFKNTSTNENITFNPAFKMKNSITTKSLMNFLNIIHGKNDEYESNMEKLNRLCPICKHRLIKYSETQIMCSNNDCQYHESFENLTENESYDEVLSLYVGEDIDICTDYKICNVKYTNELKVPHFITLRDQNGIMQTIYKVHSILETNPKFIKNQKDSFPNKEYDFLKEYLDEMDGYKNEMRIFYFLESHKKVIQNNRLTGKENKWIQISELL